MRCSINPINLFKKKWNNNLFILDELKNFYKLLLLSLTCSFLVPIFDGIGIGLLLSFLQNIISPNGENISSGLSWIDTHILRVGASEIEQILYISLLILVVTWMRSGIEYTRKISIGVVEIRLITQLREKSFQQLSQFELGYFSDIQSGDLINILTNEISRLKNFLNSATILVTNCIRIIIYSFILSLISWKLSLISLVSLSLLSLCISSIRKTVRSLSIATTKANSNLASICVEFLSGIYTIHAFSTQGIERTRFNQANERIASLNIQSLFRISLLSPLTLASGTTVILFIVLLGFTNFEIPVAQLLVFIYVLQSAVSITQYILALLGQISHLQGSFQVVSDLLENNNKPYFKNGDRIFSGLKNFIQLSSVNFAYNNTKMNVLSDINLKIEKGKMTALVGASGSGKSTLVALICRFYDPKEGQVLVDGMNLQSFEINSLRQRISIVSQETHIFNTSVRKNIAYGLEEVDDEDIYQAAQQSNALDFILKLQDGFDTQLGDRGVKLSGGQRQRIAIARALLRDPEILILDEATSALDSVSERLIQDSLEKLSVNRTVIAIAHRLSTVDRADKIVVLDKGFIVEQGSYNELLKQKGKLWHYHQVQFAQTT